VRKYLVLLSLWLGVVAGASAAETFVLANGASFSGDIVKSDDYEVMIHTSEDSYTNITWPQFSQDTLKQLAANQKYHYLAGPFIQPAAAEASPKPAGQFTYQYEQRVKLPENPSILGGLFGSSLGLFLLFAVYLANLYAAYEVAMVRGKPVAAVMGLSAVLPIIGPVIFLLQKMGGAAPEEAPAEEMPPDGGPAPGTPGAAGAPGTPAAGASAAGSAPAAHDDIQIVSASWQPSQEEKKPQPQVFARGKFTLNKRFIETKFANFIGEPKGEAKNFTMELKTLKASIPVESIKQVAPTEMILETPTGQLTVPFADIMEFRLTPRPPA
jgi:hypothetical protein